MKRLIPHICAIAICGCATNTIKGNPTVTIKNAPASKMADALTAACIAGGGRIEQASTNFLTCAEKMSDGQDFAFRAMIGGAKSDPERVTQFAWGQLADGSLTLSGSQYIQYSSGFGQQRRNNLDNDDNKRWMQDQLNKIKAAIETKTLAGPSNPVSVTAPSDGMKSKAEWRKEQIRLLQQSGVSYEEYQRRYREIMAD